MRRRPRVESFGLKPGRILAGKYEILGCLGAGWEGEVYRVRELGTGIVRAAKAFFPHRNPGDRTARRYARKLHKLRSCPILVRYHTWEAFRYRGHRVTLLVSEYVEGEILSAFLRRQPGQRLTVFEGLHLLYALASGMECIHRRREYHGDLHADNVLVRRKGLGFEVKLVDLFHWGSAKTENIHEDVCDLVRIFYDAVGGRAAYAGHPPVVKAVCCGLKRSLILSKFRTAGALRRFLEGLEWEKRG
jgi:serine/threonine protein kinase